MRNAPLLILLGMAQISLGFRGGLWGGLLIWSGLCFAAVGLAYARRRPGLFGKGSDGTLPPLRVFLLLPYLLFTWLVWYLDTRIRHETACDQIAPGLWLGRWPTVRDLPSGVTQIVDLTAEFASLSAVREGRLYLSLPTLDATAPDSTEALRIARLVAERREPTYLHCALGHGRSALIAALVLVMRGDAADTEAAIVRISHARPAVKINSTQCDWLRAIEPMIPGSGP